MIDIQLHGDVLSIGIANPPVNALGIAVRCQPAFGVRDAGNWSETAHGWQDVVLQWAKLVYYKVAVLARGA